MSHWESVNLFQHLTIVQLNTAASINNPLRSRPRCGGCHFRTFKSGGDLFVWPFQAVSGGNKGHFPERIASSFASLHRLPVRFRNDFKMCPLDLWALQMEPRWSLTGHSEWHRGVRFLLLEPQTVELSAELRHTSPLVAFERLLK